MIAPGKWRLAIRRSNWFILRKCSRRPTGLYASTRFSSLSIGDNRRFCCTRARILVDKNRAPFLILPSRTRQREAFPWLLAMFRLGRTSSYRLFASRALGSQARSRTWMKAALTLPVLATAASAVGVAVAKIAEEEDDAPSFQFSRETYKLKSTPDLMVLCSLTLSSITWS